MKKKVLLFATICMAVTANAQFRVNSNGNTSVNVTNADSAALNAHGIQAGIASYRNGGNPYWGYGVYGKSQNLGTSYSVGVYGGTDIDENYYGSSYTSAYGVYGEAKGGEYGRNYGVFGKLPDWETGAAVYGTIDIVSVHSNVYDHYGKTLNGRYAGYFTGPVEVDGSLDVTGYLTASYLSVINGENGGANASLMRAVDEDGETMTERLGSLSTVSYYKEENALPEVGSSTVKTAKMKSGTEYRRHYSLTAEELEENFPEFVYEKEDGTKMVNYVEMVPVLIQAINELNAEVRTLKGENAMMSRELNATGVAEIEATDIITLSQNDPNPWNTQTAIRMNIPERVKEATLFIYDMSGKQMAEHRISGRGDTALTLTADTLVPGMYIYTLIADGKVISTKRMILTK